MTETAGKSLSQKTVEGTITLVITRFIVRLIGFVSVSFTARLLTPEDFGLVGAASIVIGLFAIFNQIGLNEYIQRTRVIDADELQTLWTLRLLINLVLSSGVFLSAPFAADFLQDARLEEVLQVLSVVFLLGAVRAPAAEFFNRNLNYRADLFLKLADKTVAVVVTIIAAYILETYWALVWGQMTGAIFAIISSYVAKPFLPRLTMSKGRELGSFAFWTSMVGLMNYGNNHIDEWIAKRTNATAAFGAYHISRDLCRLFVAEILAPAGQVFLPAVARVQDDPEKMKEVVGRFAGAAFLAVFAVAIGIASISFELVTILLGYQWGAAVPYMPYIAIGSAAVVMGNMFAGLYVIENKQKISTRFRFMRLVGLIVACSVAGVYGDLLMLSQAYAVASVLTVSIELKWLFSGRRFQVSLIRSIWRPAIAATGMYFAVDALALGDDLNLILVTLIKVLVGAAVYILGVVILWLLAGRPVGGEREIWDRVMEFRSA